MATSRLIPEKNFYRPGTHQGNTVSDLEKMVERCLVSGPLMTVGQIRILLRVQDACTNCEAIGRKDGLRCEPCQGKGYLEPAPEPTASEWDRFESDGAPDEYDHDAEAEEVTQ